jgi:hypothetical protein
VKHVYYLLEVPDPADYVPIKLLKDVRDCMRVLNPGIRSEAAEACIGSVRRVGYGILGTDEADDPMQTLAKLREHLTDACVVSYDIDPEQRERRFQSRQLTRGGATPEQVFQQLAPGEAGENVRPITVETAYPTAAKTAFMLMVPTDGNPLNAAVTALNLGRTTGDTEDYNDVVRFIIQCAPWVEEMLRAGGYWK